MVGDIMMCILRNPPGTAPCFLVLWEMDSSSLAQIRREESNPRGPRKKRQDPLWIDSFEDPRLDPDWILDWILIGSSCPNYQFLY